MSDSLRMPDPPHSPPATDPDGRYLFTHDLSGTEELGTTVTRAVAQVTGASPATVGIDLSEAVDCDGLDRLFPPPGTGTSRPGGRLVLAVAGCHVTIGSDGTIAVEPCARTRHSQ